METIGIGVVVALISAAIIHAARWSAAGENREVVHAAIRRRVCRHEWEPIPASIITGDEDWCTRCDARR